MRRFVLGLALLQMAGGVGFGASTLSAGAQAAAAAEQKSGVLSPAEIDTLVPSVVFFKGKSAPVQVRNAGGVRFADQSIFFAALVDTSGYASTVREKYQFYLVTETPLEIGGKTLVAGAYGCGFVDDNFIVMDIGGHDMMSAKTKRDAEMKRPRPLQVVAGATAGEFQLMLGRQVVSFKQAAR